MHIRWFVKVAILVIIFFPVYCIISALKALALGLMIIMQPVTNKIAELSMKLHHWSQEQKDNDHQ